MSLAPTPRVAAPKPPPIFEFTKRKKWANILISELSGSVLLLLNPTANMLWVSPSISELLGWQDEELLQRPIRDIFHDDDIAPFIKRFNHAMNTRTELFTYSRLRSKFGSPSSGSSSGSPPGPSHSALPNPPASLSATTLFELRGYSICSRSTPDSVGVESGSSFMPNLEPNLDVEPESSCFVIMARPYLSRNTAMLDSFLELKIENERLRQQLLNLRTLAAPGLASPTLTSPTYPINQISSISDTPLAPPSPALGSPIYHSTNLNALSLGGTATSGDADAAYQPHTIHAMPQPPAATNVYYPTQTNRSGRKSHDIMFPFNSNRAGPSVGSSGAPSPALRASTAEMVAIEPPEDGRPRKKASAPKRAHPAQEQYVCVTCGRTDSPEWRKGPLGAKTLCNACGLRWAKRNSKRKMDEFGVDTGGGG